MTEQPETTPEAPAQAAGQHTVTPRKGSELDQLHDAYLTLHAEKADVEAKFKAVGDQIKVLLNGMDPEERRFELVGKDGRRPLQLRYSETRRFDSTRFKREQPEAYVSFLKPPSGSWTLQPAKDGGDS